MKRFLTLFLCLCFLLTLTACGGKRKDNSGGTDGGSSSADNGAGSSSGSGSDSGAGSNSGSTDGTTENGDAETRVGIGSGNNIFGMGNSSLRSQVYQSRNGSSGTDGGNSAMTDANSSNFQNMLRNGRVRDTDGDLTDGENALRGVYGKNVTR